MQLSAYAYTNRGGRDHNEDSLRASAEQGIFVLADGLGGHRCGEVASQAAVDAIFTGMAQAEALEEASLLDLFRSANEELLRRQAQPGQEEMRTTAVALKLAGSTAVWAHIGDSRLYRFSDGELAEVTQDHSVTYRKFLGGEISYMDVYHDDDRSRLLRVLGKEPCRPEAGQAAVSPGDAFLLCSDGFWEFVYNEEIQADLCRARTPEEWAEGMLLRHIRRTPPGSDNFSLITVFVEACG